MVRARLTQELESGWESSMDGVRLRARNEVAHPGQLLVTCAEDVEPLWQTCAFAETAMVRLG